MVKTKELREREQFIVNVIKNIIYDTSPSIGYIEGVSIISREYAKLLITLSDDTLLGKILNAPLSIGYDTDDIISLVNNNYIMKIFALAASPTILSRLEICGLKHIEYNQYELNILDAYNINNYSSEEIELYLKMVII